MRNILKYTLIFVLLLSTLCGCEDDLLEQVNPNAVTTDSFWKTAEDFDKATNALYSSLQFGAVSGQGLVKNMVRSDLAGSESWYADAAYSNLIWNDGSDNVKERWSELYVGIFRANQILYYIEGADFLSDSEKESIIAQTRFLRGLNYFWLIQSYNQAIIQDVLPIDVADMHKPLSSREEVVSTMIIPDLTYAYDHLPKKWSDGDTGRFTWGAAASMLGKTYLYEKDWTNAAKFFKEVIDAADNDGLYALVPNFMDNFTIENEFNSESILEVAYSDNYKEGASGSRTDDMGDTPGSEATSIASSFASITGAGGYNTCLPTYWLQELFVAGDSIDLTNPVNTGMRYSQRTYATIVVEFGDGDYYQAPLTPTATVKSKANFSYGQGSKVKKWTSWYYKDSEDTSTGARSGINFRHIRLADVYLMYAEAVLEIDGNTTEALKYIEKVRARAGVLSLQHYMDNNGGMIPVLDKVRFPNGLAEYDMVALTKESLMHHLRMVERPLELAFEGHRWYDLVRWGIIAETFTQRKVEEDAIKVKLIDPDANPVALFPKFFPLYLNQRVRPDWVKPAANYNSAVHDYYPIPSIEVQSNREL